jgi:trehalose-6-phosphatase
MKKFLSYLSLVCLVLVLGSPAHELDAKDGAGREFRFQISLDDNPDDEIRFHCANPMGFCSVLIF